MDGAVNVDHIARVVLVAVDATGDRTPFVCGIGRPAREPTGEWRCAVSLEGLHDDLVAMHGEDGRQALCLALGLAASLLRSFSASGGTIEFAEGEEFLLEAYFGWFGSPTAPAD